MGLSKRPVVGTGESGSGRGEAPSPAELASRVYAPREELMEAEDDGGYVGFQDSRRSGEVVSAGRVVLPRSVRVECITGGALLTVEFGAGVSPAEALEYLRGEDGTVKFKTEFPSKGGFGPKETKLALVLGMNVRVSDSGKFVELMCHAAGDDFDVGVGRNSVESFLADVKAVGKLSEQNVRKVEKAFDEKSKALVMLTEGERFGVKYFERDGRRFSEGYQAEGPVEK